MKIYQVHFLKLVPRHFLTIFLSDKHDIFENTKNCPNKDFSHSLLKNLKFWKSDEYSSFNEYFKFYFYILVTWPNIFFEIRTPI